MSDQSDDELEQARALIQAGLRPATLAAELGVTKGQIADALAAALLPFVIKQKLRRLSLDARGVGLFHQRPLHSVISVNALEISVRSENALSNANIRSLDQLCQLTLVQVRRLVGNKRNVQEIREELARFGRVLSDDTVMARQIAGLPPL